MELSSRSLVKCLLLLALLCGCNGYNRMPEEDKKAREVVDLPDRAQWATMKAESKLPEGVSVGPKGFVYGKEMRGNGKDVGRGIGNGGGKRNLREEAGAISTQTNRNLQSNTQLAFSVFTLDGTINGKIGFFVPASFPDLTCAQNGAATFHDVPVGAYRYYEVTMNNMSKGKYWYCWAYVNIQNGHEWWVNSLAGFSNTNIKNKIRVTSGQHFSWDNQYPLTYGVPVQHYDENNLCYFERSLAFQTNEAYLLDFTKVSGNAGSITGFECDGSSQKLLAASSYAAKCSAGGHRRNLRALPHGPTTNATSLLTTGAANADRDLQAFVATVGLFLACEYIIDSVSIAAVFGAVDVVSNGVLIGTVAHGTTQAFALGDYAAGFALSLQAAGVVEVGATSSAIGASTVLDGMTITAWTNQVVAGAASGAAEVSNSIVPGTVERVIAGSIGNAGTGTFGLAAQVAPLNPVNYISP